MEESKTPEPDDVGDQLSKELNDAEGARDWARVALVWKKIFVYHQEMFRKGDASAAIGLATAYFTGEGTEKDLRKSWEMFKEAERLGCKEAVRVRYSYFGGDESPDRRIALEANRRSGK